MKKFLATLLAMSMIFATTVAFAAEPVATSVNPKITVVVDDVVTMDMGDGNGERAFAVVSANLELPEGTLSDKITYNSITKIASGTGIASFTFNVAFDSTLFDMTTSYIVQTDEKGEWGYNANEGYMGGAMAGNANGMYVGTLAPMLQYYVALKDASATADALNAKAFAEVKLAEMRIETFNNAKTATYSTKYSSNAADTTRNYDFATQVGTGAPAPIDPVDPDAVLGDDTAVDTDDDAKTKTWTVTVGKNIVGKALKATLTNDKYEVGTPQRTQTVDLTFDSSISGDASLAFDVIVHFYNAASAATTTLDIALAE